MQPISTVGFLHDSGDYQTRPFLARFWEPFRSISDVVVFEAFESGVLDLLDSYFTGDDYRYRFEPEAKQRFLDPLREQFNSGIRCKGRALKWDRVIEQKTVELGRYLIGRSPGLDFSEPCFGVSEIDNREIRKRILSLTQQEARRLGIGKSTLHYLRRNAKAVKPLRICGKVAARMRNTGP